MGDEALLRADSLVKSYRHREGILDRFSSRTRASVMRPALGGVSISVHRGESVGVVGESGSGKTTLARCLTLLERPDAGRVFLDGTELTKLKGSALRQQRRRIQVIFQDPYSSLNPRMTVGDALTEVLRVHHLVPSTQVERRAAELLEQVGLSARAGSRYPSDLSGGQRQRVCIARALAAQPDVLIADEAVSALDVSIQAQILNLLQEVQTEFGLAMIFISHNLYVVRHVSQTVAVMFGGRIVEVLPPDAPLEAAEHPYTKALLAAVPKIEASASVEVAERGPEVAAMLPIVGCPYRQRCPYAFEPCTTIDPDLEPVAEGHVAACHYVVQTVRGAR